MTINTNADGLMEQASMTAQYYLTEANRHVSAAFGAEYCTRNPEFRARLIAAYIAACAVFQTAMTAAQAGR